MDSKTHAVSRRNVDFKDGNSCIEGRDIIVHGDTWNNEDHPVERAMTCTLHKWRSEPANTDHKLDIIVRYRMDADNGFVMLPWTVLTTHPALVFETTTERQAYVGELTRICKWNMNSSIHDAVIAYHTKTGGGNHD